jgi:hypothetical protein
MQLAKFIFEQHNNIQHHIARRTLKQLMGDMETSIYKYTKENPLKSTVN